MKKVLYISTRIFWPTNSGKKITTFFNALGMKEAFNYDVYVYTFLEPDQKYEEAKKPSFLTDVRVAQNISKFTKLSNILFKFIFQGFSFQSSLYYSNKNKRKIEEYIEEIKPDIVIVDMVRLSRYVSAFKKFSGIKVINLDDLLSLRYERILSKVTDNTDIGGQYTKENKGLLKKLISFNFLKKIILKIESKRVRKEEILSSKNYDYAYFVSKRETKIYNDFTKTNKAVCITMGVDTKYYSENFDEKVTPNLVSFVGNFNYAANVESLSMIVNDILPLCKTDVTLRAIGPVSQEIKNKFINNKNVTFTGEVDDLRPYVKSSAIALIPIKYGSGIKTKVVEALAMGLPIITNSIGVEGLMVEHNKELIIADNYNDIASYIDEIINNPKVGKKLSENAMKFAKENHDWNLIWEDLSLIGFKKGDKNENI